MKKQVFVILSFVIFLSCIVNVDASSSWRHVDITPESGELGFLPGIDGAEVYDFDDDGKFDILATFEEGNKIQILFNDVIEANTWNPTNIGDPYRCEASIVEDLDRNGYPDVVSACEGSRKIYVSWSDESVSSYDELRDSSKWENEEFIPASLMGGTTKWHEVNSIEIDGEIYIIASAYRTLGGIYLFDIDESNPRDLSLWTAYNVRPRIPDLTNPYNNPTPSWVASIKVLDVDNDGDDDIVYTDRGAFEGGLENGGIGWIEIDPAIFPPVSIPANQPPYPGYAIQYPLTDHVIHNAYAFDNQDSYRYTTIADLDNDGIKDIITPVSTAQKIIWSKRVFSPSLNWINYEIDVPDGTFGIPKAVAVGDLYGEGDGKNEIVLTTARATGDELRVAAFEHSVGDPSTWTWSHQEISTEIPFSLNNYKYDTVDIVDMDGDGDMDILTSEENQFQTLFWYKQVQSCSEGDLSALASQTEGSFPLNVNFSLTDLSGDCLTSDGIKFSWDFDGDGIVDSNEMEPSYTYPLGVYETNLNVKVGEYSENFRFIINSYSPTNPIYGKVLLDSNADGNIEDGVGVEGATVNLYADNGDNIPNILDTLVETDVTRFDGLYSFSYFTLDKAWIVVDASTIRPDVVYTDNPIAEQIFGSRGALCQDPENKNNILTLDSPGKCSGGRRLHIPDSNLDLNSSEHIIGTDSLAPGEYDFGFSFDTVSNTNDEGQGSLRQAMLNSNFIEGSNHIKFNLIKSDNSCLSYADDYGGGINYPHNSSGSTIDPTNRMVRCYDIYADSDIFWWRIAPRTELPYIEDNETIIDGYSQEGSIENTRPLSSTTNAVLKVEINGDRSETDIYGIKINSKLNVIKGLVINQFDGEVDRKGALTFHSQASKFNSVFGNYIGTDITGMVARPNLDEALLIKGGARENYIGKKNNSGRNLIAGNNSDSELKIRGGQTNMIYNNMFGTDAIGENCLSTVPTDIIKVKGSSANQIGGNNRSKGNIVSCGRNGINVTSDTDKGIFYTSQNTHIEFNKIGTNKNGSRDLPNIVGVNIEDGSDGTIVMNNLISGNTGEGISVTGRSTDPVDYTIIKKNSLGLQEDFVSPLSNGGNGLSISDNVINTIIGGGPNAVNKISNSGNCGIGISSGPADAGTRIYNNTINDNLNRGICLEEDAGTGHSFSKNIVFGNSTIEEIDIEGLANNNQSFPNLGSVVYRSRNLEVFGTLNSTANNSFLIEVYKNNNTPLSHGEAKEYVGSFIVNTNASGIADFSTTPSVINDVDFEFGQAITTIATRCKYYMSDCSVLSDSSELSPNIEILFL